VRVYAGPDLKLAYIRRDGEVTARAIVWPSNLVHTRVYGDETRLIAALHAAGYSEGSIEGARIRKIAHGYEYVCPYIDYVSAVSDNGDWLVIDESGEYNAQCTHGLTEGSSYETCSACDERYPEDELSYYEAADGSLCSGCADDIIRHCDHCENSVHRDNINYSASQRMDICDDCVSSHYARCAWSRCDALVPSEDAITDMDGDTVCSDCAESNYTHCEPCGEWWPNGEVNESGHCENCAESEEKENADADGEESGDADAPARCSLVQPIPTAGSFEYVRAWATETPGIVVTRATRSDASESRRFVVTHAASGLSAGIHSGDRDAATRAANALGAHPIDWTLAADELTRAELIDATRRAVADARDAMEGRERAPLPERVPDPAPCAYGVNGCPCSCPTESENN